MLAPEEARALLDSIDVSTSIGLPDRALIGQMVFSFARIGAALGMKVETIRHVHYVTHPDYPSELRVGCVCAENLTEDYVVRISRDRGQRFQSIVGSDFTGRWAVISRHRGYPC